MFPGKFTRYVLWDVLKIFLLTLVAMTLVISLAVVGQQLVSEGVGWFAILKLLPYIFLIALQFSVPATLLFSVCCVYGRISADNEIIALKSAGISPMHLFRPALLIGLLLSIPAVWLNDMAVSWGRPGMQRVVLRSVEQILYSTLRAQRSYTSDKGFAIHVKDVQERWLIKPTIVMYGPTSIQTITSERAKITLDPDSDQMILELVDSYVDIVDGGGTKQIKWPDLMRLPMQLDKTTTGAAASASPSSFAISQIGEELQRQDRKNNERREKLATRFAMSLASARFNQIADGNIHALESELEESQRRIARLKTEPARRWALGFSCLFFVWMGVPMAILVRSADYWWSFGLCFLPILLIYYPLFGLALDRAKDGSWPAFSLWLGNVVLMLIGTWLMRKVVRT